MSISEISIRNPVFAWMLMSFLIVFGGISFTRMGISQLPDVDFPVVSVNLSMVGAAPEVMERDVVDVIENSVMSIQGVKHVLSTSKNGSANVTIQLDINRDIDVAVQDVQAKIAEAQKKLPKLMDPPVITKTNPEDQPILWITLESETHSLRELMIYVRDHLQQEFLTTPELGDINFGGYIDPNLRIWVSNKDLKKYELTVGDIISTIQNEHSEPPAGWIDENKKEYNVRTLGEALSPEEFGKMSINNRGGAPNYSPIPLNKVAKVEEGLADVRRVSRGNGKPAVGLGIRKQRGSNAVAVARATKAKMADLEKRLPKGMHLALNFDSTVFIEEAVDELNLTLLLSAILTALVCWLFLGSWSSTLNVLLSIPTSIVGTFIVLAFSGFTLNTFTLLGLSLAIGIVVDDSIMVLENIIRHLEMGKSRMEAALVGSKEITFAAIAASVSIIAIFLPVAFMEGIIGKFFFQFGVTMTVAVLLSLVEALTITPMRCSQFLESKERTSFIGHAVDKSFHWLKGAYARSLAFALRFRWSVVFLSLLMFAGSFYFLFRINKEFIPQEDQSRFMVRVQTPIGSSIRLTDEKMKLMEDFLSKRQEILRYYVAIGGFGGGDVNTGIIFVTLKNKGKRGIDANLGHEASQSEMMAICREAFNKIPDVRANMQDLSMRGFTASRGFPLEFTIRGPDWDKLGEYTTLLMKELNSTGFVSDLDTDYLAGMPEIHIIPNRIKASDHGVSVTDLGNTINALIGGLVVSTYPRGGHRDDIRVKLLDENTARFQKLNSIYVRNNRGEMVSLAGLVSIEEKPTLSSVARVDRERAVTIFGNIAKGKSQEETLDKVSEISKRVLPAGYFTVLTGSAEDFKATFQSLVLALVLGLIIAYMVLASQFNSFLDPFSVLMALPFSMSGAFFALYFTGQTLNMYSMIGLLLLMGIVKKNSILLVDFTNQMRAKGLSLKEALIEACPLRLRPIFMTSLATIVGAIPAALSWGPGAETRRPMAIAVIGGVLLSTLLTLYVVPCVYSLLARLELRKFTAPDGRH